MIQYMLQVAIAMALLIIPYFLFFQKETFFRFNRAYLITALVLAIVAPFAPRWIAIGDASAALVLLQPIEIMTMQEVAVSANINGQTHDAWHFINMTYWIIAMLLIGKLLIEISGIARIYQIGEREKYDGKTIVVHEEIKAPFSFFNAIFLPREIRNDHDRFSKIFKHEATHIEYKHSIDAVLVEMLCAIFWINPLVYIYQRALKAIHEYQADNVIMESDLVEYTQLLLAQSQSGLRLVLTNQFFQPQLKARIVMMMKQRSHEVNKWKYLFAIPVLAIAILLFSFKNTERYPADNETIFEQSVVMYDTIPQVKQVVYKEADEMPRFPGCEDVEDVEKRDLCSQKRLLQHVFENIKYPADARKNGIQGTVVVQFNVNSAGEVRDAKVVRGIGGGCDEESVRVVSALDDLPEKWTPGKIDGKPVSVQMTLPIKYKLSEDEGTNPKVMEAGADVYKTVEEMPLFPGCDDEACSQKKLMEYVFENLKYPEQARAEKVEGKVVVTFVVEPNGVISSIKVPKGLNAACDAEVIRVIESMNSIPGRWTPGMEEGEKVRVQYALPVMFKL